MNIVFSRTTHNWFKHYKVCFKSLRNIIKYLCYKEGYPSNKTLYIHIKKNGIHSEYDLIKNRIIVGIDITSKNKNQRIRRMVRNLLHELRHFIQYKIHRKLAILSYSQKDMMTVNDKYWFAPEEIDARKYEIKKLKFVLKKIKLLKR